MSSLIAVSGLCSTGAFSGRENKHWRRSDARGKERNARHQASALVVRKGKARQGKLALKGLPLHPKTCWLQGVGQREGVHGMCHHSSMQERVHQAKGACMHAASDAAGGQLGPSATSHAAPCASPSVPHLICGHLSLAALCSALSLPALPAHTKGDATQVSGAPAVQEHAAYAVLRCSPNLGSACGAVGHSGTHTQLNTELDAACSRASTH